MTPALLLLAASDDPSKAGGIVGLTVTIMEKLGLFGAAVASGLDSFFPFIPSEVVLPLVGFTAGKGTTYGLTEALIAVNVGAIVGASLMYWFSVWFGRDRTAWVFERIPLLKVDDLEKAENWFAKYGSAAVFFGRFVPGVRCLISVPAGIERMPFWKFVLLTFVGAGIWNSLFVVLGWKLGDNWDQVEPYAHWFSRITIVVIVTVVIAFVYVRVRELRRGEL